MKALAEVGRQSWRLNPWWLVLSGLFYLAGLFPSGWFWHRLICSLGGQPTLGQTLRSYYIGHLGKYVPGKAMVIVLRAGLLRGQQVDVVLASATIFLETLTSMAVGALLAAVIIVSVWRELETGRRSSGDGGCHRLARLAARVSPRGSVAPPGKGQPNAH